MRPQPFVRGPLASWNVLDRAVSQPPADFDAEDAQSTAIEFSSVAIVDSGYVVSFSGLARFHIDTAERTIFPFDILDDATQEDLTHLLSDHIAPRILAYEGHLVLHGSAVEIAGEAVIFVGETGAGKSTLAASLHRAGHRLLGDDAAIISQIGGRMLAEPVYPSLRLYPDTISALIDETAELSSMAHYSDKQHVDLAELSGPPPAPLPIAAIFFLSGKRDATAAEARTPSPSQSCIKLLEQSFALDPKDARRAAKRMALASQLTENIPAYEIGFAYDYDRLREVHTLIAACLERGRQRAD